MVPSEEYWRVDGWPDEASRNLYVKATSEIPLLQDTLCHIFVIGISKQHPINGRDIIDLAECLVKRAAGLHPLISDDFQVMKKPSSSVTTYLTQVYTVDDRQFWEF